MWMDSPQSQARSGRVSPPSPPTLSTPGLRVPPLTSQDRRDACSFALPCPPNRAVWGNGLGGQEPLHPPSSCLSERLRVWARFFPAVFVLQKLGAESPEPLAGPRFPCQEHPERGAASVRDRSPRHRGEEPTRIKLPRTKRTVSPGRACGPHTLRVRSDKGTAPCGHRFGVTQQACCPGVCAFLKLFKTLFFMWPTF